MAKDELPGLLSKVVKFVRNPTVDWADLSEPESNKDEAYSKLQLKEMIERKRRNDFVRRREFDQLRKLRSREAHGGPDLAERPSFFQSSLPSQPMDDRAGTLKKIDEIEEQMSQQWWKTHKETARSSMGGGPITAVGEGLSGADYALTEAASLGASQIAADAVLPAGDTSLSDQPWTTRFAVTVPGEFPMGAVPVSGMEEPVFVHATDLEESAIRFANGDTEGAEQNLLQLLADTPSQQYVWMALFDLYRATGQQARFDAAALDYAVRFDRLAPLWLSFPELPGIFAGSGGGDQEATSPPGFHWSCPRILGAPSVATLSAQLAYAPQPWRFDWSALAEIDGAAVDVLAEQLERWSAGAVRLRFVGEHTLLELLRHQTPSGDTSVATAWWRLRMEALRITGHPDAFDLAALEYCVTYEVSPPSWSPVRCEYVSVSPDSTDSGGLSLDDALPSEMFPVTQLSDSVMSTTRSPPLPMAELAGQMAGDVSAALVALESCAQEGVLVVSCDKLARVDFSAAGSILNWVAARQAAACQVIFSNPHRLVAVFFNVIGINEHARVLPRKD